jgi:hypothetical protein
MVVLTQIESHTNAKIKNKLNLAPPITTMALAMIIKYNITSLT